MPRKPTKFGTFAGVFTPSILTILGVIMYMRLGWVVGQAGLISALVIILIAHIISVSTGLSISSIATDKKIRAGGIYYILSRSLGLPMGGAIGIALFIGTALSISLYLVGFAESFLGIEPIREFLGLEQDVNGYRIIGTAAILILVVLAFISTSLAIKTQFYILGAIVLSLVSIGVGFYLNADLAPETALLTQAPEKIPLELVFAIFFPAVTGFTAGVAMSGDLKNPKSSIPVGTLVSIATGLLVYVALAIGLAFFVNRELLLTDKNFLLRIAWFSPFVIAGIWGATLSSAMGGILGGPRILQAISADRITPKLFAKTYGKDNEPRVALIFIFLIAEAGILIGELNVIAGIVSMFYLASYGFINLAFFLESWASTDFRPSFKVNRFVGFIGFIAAFGVMFKLDMLSMFASLIIMWGLYFYLKRRKFKSNYGDVWQSVYSSIVRTALHKMDKQESEDRNWKPNIILFSGGTQKRPHLLEFGKCIVGKHGVMSNFDLIENKNANVLFPKRKQSLPVEDTDFGIFTRKKTVRDIYEGIETISGIYGFSGFEPNTILLGWARQTQNPERFVQTLNTLFNLDLNVLLLDYDKDAGFGNYNKVDIWWKDVSNQGNLALSLTKLILLSGHWQHAKVRLMIVNSKNEFSNSILIRAEHLIEGMRIAAEVKVINNEIEQESLYEIMLSESKTTDLVIVGVPDIIKGKESEYVEATNNLLHKIGTVLLIKSSSTFKNLSLGMHSERSTYISDNIAIEPEIEKGASSIKFPEKEELKTEFESQYEVFTRIIDDFQNDYIIPSFKYNANKTSIIEKNLSDTISALTSDTFLNTSLEKQIKIIATLKTNFFVRSVKILEELQKTILDIQKNNLENGLGNFIKRIQNTIAIIPSRKSITLFKNDFEPNVADPYNAGLYKKAKRKLRSNKKLNKGINYNLKLRKLFNSELPENVLKSMYEGIEKLGHQKIYYIVEFLKLIYTLDKAFETFEQKKGKKISTKNISAVKQEVNEIMNRISKSNAESQKLLSGELYNQLASIFTELSTISNKVPTNYFIKDYPSVRIKNILNKIYETPDYLTSKQDLLLTSTTIEIKFLLIKYRLCRIVNETIAEIKKKIEELVNDKVTDLQKLLEEYNASLKKSKSGEFKLQQNSLQIADKNTLQLQIDRIADKAFRNIKSVIDKLPKSSELLSIDAYNDLTNLIFEDTETVKISTFQLVDFYVQNNLLEPLVNITSSLSEDLNNHIIKIKDAVRRVSFGDTKPDVLFEETERIYEKDDYSLFVNDQIDIVNEELHRINEKMEEVEKNLKKQIVLTNDELSIYRLLKNPDKYKRYLKKADVSKKVSIYRQKVKKLKLFIQKQKAYIWYKQSDAILFARKITEKEEPAASLVNTLLNIKDSISPSEDTLNKLPFYYQQLFLRKYNYQSEFWFNRKPEINEIKKAIARHKNGHSGAILIRGERNSGKTFFANLVASTMFNNQNVYYIPAAPAGSINETVLLKTIQDTSGLKGSLLNIFSKLPENAFIIFDNLELWWEKSENGTEVIKILGDLVQRFGSRYMFLFTVNKESYSIINEMSNIENYFLNIIDLPPFNSEGLQEIIMFRHKSSGFELKNADNPNKKIHNTDLAKLFSRYFNFSKGNVGVTLLAWVANIIEVHDKKITICQPQIPDVSVLKSIEPDLLVYLSLFIIHKRIDINKMQRITLDTKEKVEENLLFLKRAGLIIETAGQIYELDNYLYMHVKNVLLD